MKKKIIESNDIKLDDDILQVDDAKNFILSNLDDIKEALNRNDFSEVMQICDWIARECDEILNN